MTLRRVLCHHNSAVDLGGCLAAVEVQHLCLLNSSFHNNQVLGADSGGGAIAADSSGNVTVDRCVTRNNTALGGNGEGGAIYLSSTTGHVLIQHSSFTTNRVSLQVGTSPCRCGTFFLGSHC